MVNNNLRIWSVILSLLALGACDNTTYEIKYQNDVTLIPYPKEISQSNEAVALSDESTIFGAEEISGVLEVFQSELYLVTGMEFQIASQKDKYSDVLFSLDTLLNKDEYIIQIDRTVNIIGGSYQALTMAKTSLIQLLFMHEGLVHFPKLTIKDQPDLAYRGLMIDLARNWHSMETLKKIIDLAAFYKSNYLQLHFTDYQSYTLPSKKYPNLSTPNRHYSFEDLKELESYSRERGVIIIPEIDIPGHSSSMVNAYPDLFGIADIEENPWIINMGKEEVYEALASIFSEIIPIFKSSPYFHIGGDEAIFHKTENDPFAKSYMEQNSLKDVHELYRHFIVRMNDLVKSHGKQLCVWEGFGRDGDVVIPKDILVYEFETNKYLPDHLVEDGYSVINTSWKPLYVVNQKKWEPKTIYHWNPWRWENWFPKAPSFTPIQLDPTPLVLGAQMCAWEQQEDVEIPSIRKRLPALNERIWNTENNPGYDSFIASLEQLDSKLSLIIKDDRQDKLLWGHNFEKEDN